MSDDIVTVKVKNPWERISVVAAKVGVKPISGRLQKPALTAMGVDGERYDIFEVIEACLDRLVVNGDGGDHE